MKYEYMVYRRLENPVTVEGIMIEEHLLDIVIAEDETKAVQMVAENLGISTERLYAEGHISSAVSPEGNARIEAASFVNGSNIGIDIILNSGNEDGITNFKIEAEAPHYIFNAKRSTNKEKRFYVLQYSTDYDDICIAASLSEMQDAKLFVKNKAARELVEFGVVNHAIEGFRMYERAESGNDPVMDRDYISVYGNGATVRYGDSETKWQIVEY